MDPAQTSEPLLDRNYHPRVLVRATEALSTSCSSLPTALPSKPKHTSHKSYLHTQAQKSR